MAGIKGIPRNIGIHSMLSGKGLHCIQAALRYRQATGALLDSAQYYMCNPVPTTTLRRRSSLRVQRTGLPPIHLQHSYHSVNLGGVELRNDGLRSV